MLRQIGDFPLEQLTGYKPDLTREQDFSAFWEEIKLSINEMGIEASFDWLDYPVKGIKAADVTLTSWDGTPIRAWFITPEKTEPTPAMLQFHGYTDSRGYINQYLKWALQGITVISFEVRGQGFTPDFARYPNGTQRQGWMALGIEEKEKYYYANVYKDVMSCVNWAFQREEVNSDKVAVFGGSQGGALALVAAALNENISAVLADCPFLSHFERALQIAESPYTEILQYFRFRDPERKKYEHIMKNLSYFDVMNFAPSISCPALLSIGLEDNVTPPSTVFAVYNHLSSSEKDIKTYPEHGHELIPQQEEERIKFIARHLLGR